MGLPLSLPEVSALVADAINERTLRCWLVAWVEASVLARTGKKRGTRYAYISDQKVFDGERFNNNKKDTKHTPTLLHGYTKQIIVLNRKI